MSFGQKPHKPARNKRLTPEMKKKGMEFVFNYEILTIEEWVNVMFSDESTYQQFTVRYQREGRPQVKTYDEKYR